MDITKSTQVFNVLTSIWNQFPQKTKQNANVTTFIRTQMMLMDYSTSEIDDFMNTYDSILLENLLTDMANADVVPDYIDCNELIVITKRYHNHETGELITIECCNYWHVNETPEETFEAAIKSVLLL